MKHMIAVTLAVVLMLPGPALAAQRPMAPAVETVAVHELAAAIPLGSRVKVQTTAGRRLTATLMAVGDDGVVLKRASRVPEAAVVVPFSELASLELASSGGGMSVAKAVGIGLAAGAGAILSLIAFAFAVSD